MKGNKLLLALLIMTIPSFDTFSIKKRHFSLYQPNPFLGKWSSTYNVCTVLKECLPHQHNISCHNIYNSHSWAKFKIILLKKNWKIFFTVFEFKNWRCLEVFPLNFWIQNLGVVVFLQIFEILPWFDISFCIRVLILNFSKECRYL